MSDTPTLTPPPEVADDDPTAFVTREDFTRYRHYINKDVAGLRNRLNHVDRALADLAAWLERQRTTANKEVTNA